MSRLVTIQLNDETRLIIDSFNWTLQTGILNSETGEVNWDNNTSRFFPDLEWFAQGLLRYNIQTNVINGMEVIEAIQQAKREVKEAVKMISKRIDG